LFIKCHIVNSIYCSYKNKNSNHRLTGPVLGQVLPGVRGVLAIDLSYVINSTEMGEANIEYATTNK
jgi:hypothetical protein